MQVKVSRDDAATCERFVRQHPELAFPAIEYQLRNFRTYQDDKDTVKLGMMLQMVALTLPLDKVAIGNLQMMRCVPLGLPAAVPAAYKDEIGRLLNTMADPDGVHRRMKSWGGGRLVGAPAASVRIPQPGPGDEATVYAHSKAAGGVCGHCGGVLAAKRPAPDWQGGHRAMHPAPCPQTRCLKKAGGACACVYRVS